MSNPTLDAIDTGQHGAEYKFRLALFEVSKRQAATEAKLSDAMELIERLEDRLDLHKALIDAQHDNAESLAATDKANERWNESSEREHACQFNQINQLRTMLGNANDRIDWLGSQLAEATKRIDFLADLSRRDEKAVGFAPQGDAADAPTWTIRPDAKYARVEESGGKFVAPNPFFTVAMKDAITKICAMKSEDLKNLIGYQDKPADAPTFDTGKVRGLLLTMSGLLHEVMRARNTNGLFGLSMESAMGDVVANEWYRSACKAVANASARVAEMAPERKD